MLLEHTQTHRDQPLGSHEQAVLHAWRAAAPEVRSGHHDVVGEFTQVEGEVLRMPFSHASVGTQVPPGGLTDGPVRSKEGTC